MQQVRVLGQLSIQNAVIVSADVIGNMPVQDVGQDQGRGAIALD
jgi:hypothetical protein